MGHHVFIAGSGKIGSLIATMLLDSKDYIVHIGDVQFEGDDAKILFRHFPEVHSVTIDVQQEAELINYFKQHHIEAALSCLPFFANKHVAIACEQSGVAYFDLTEDVSVTSKVKALAKNSKNIFVPQCGLAPGFITIVANELMQHFDEVDEVKMRVGALPQNSNNTLRYNLTWSTDGVINEYGNPCHAIEQGEAVILHPLEGLESLILDGESYEAFNTSGGLGSLPELYKGKVKRMNYKTMRYPGHCQLMRFLMNDLRMNSDRDTLKRILERAIPKTYQDVVVVYVTVKGYRDGQYMEDSYLNKIYPAKIASFDASAIQVATAAGICAVVDIVLSNADNYHGFVYQEQIPLTHFLDNRFGRHYVIHDHA